MAIWEKMIDWASRIARKTKQKEQAGGERAWEWALKSEDFGFLDLMASHPSSEHRRIEVRELLKSGALKPQDIPKTWAIEEARQLREELGGASGADANCKGAGEPGSLALDLAAQEAQEGKKPQASQGALMTQESTPTPARAARRI